MKKLTLKKGALAFVDTSNCFHYGSRCLTQARNILMIQYTSIARSDLREFLRFSKREEKPSYKNYVTDFMYLKSGKK